MRYGHRDPSKQDQIESRKPFSHKPARLKEFPQIQFILFGSLCRAGKLTEDPMNMKFVCGQTPEHRVVGHTEVALGMVGWDVAFVAKEKMNFRPWNFATNGIVCCHQLIKGFGGRASRKRDCENAMVFNSIVCQQSQPFGRREG